jgi:hypothetical protein
MQTSSESGSPQRPVRLLAALAVAAFALAFLPGGTTAAQAQDAEFACRQDAFRLCSQFIPNEARVRQCMRRNARRLSPVCRAAFLHKAKPTRRTSRAHRRHRR